MDLLRTAVVDITTLVSTSRALAHGPALGDMAFGPRLRSRLRQEIRRSTVAYIDTLARPRHGVVDGELLAACRVASERCMVRALRRQEALDRMLSEQPGALTGLAAARQDLWRLSHMAIHLHVGVEALRDAVAWTSAKRVQKSASRLRRSLRKALVAYARAHLRVDGIGPGGLFEARQAAWSEIQRHGIADARRLCEFEASSGAPHQVLEVIVLKALRDLALDWGCDTGRGIHGPEGAA